MSPRAEHAQIREQLSLFVAEALDPDTASKVARHLAGCADCSEEFERWKRIASALKRLPTPELPAALFERTRAAAAAQLAARAEQSRNRIVLLLLIVFSWAVTLAGWPIFRFASAGLFSLLDVNFRETWLLFVLFSVGTWLAGGSAALLLSLRRREEGRFA
jgi:anti-sigma factor RsiW